jgi:hypothetical protein
VKLRLIAAVALAAGLALSVSGAEAATKVLDGKKVKVLKLTVAGGMQAHDDDNVKHAIDVPDKYDTCEASRCKRLPFVYKPAKGVKGGLMITAGWTSNLSDFDLYLFEVQKDKSGLDVGHCGSFTGPNRTEKLYVDRTALRSGRTYVLLVDSYRSINDTLNAKVEINVPDTTLKVVPEAYDGEFPGTVYSINCGL